MAKKYYKIKVIGWGMALYAIPVSHEAYDYWSCNGDLMKDYLMALDNCNGTSFYEENELPDYVKIENPELGFIKNIDDVPNAIRCYGVDKQGRNMVKIVEYKHDTFEGTKIETIYEDEIRGIDSINLEDIELSTDEKDYVLFYRHLKGRFFEAHLTLNEEFHLDWFEFTGHTIIAEGNDLIDLIDGMKYDGLPLELINGDPDEENRLVSLMEDFS